MRRRVIAVVLAAVLLSGGTGATAAAAAPTGEPTAAGSRISEPPALPARNHSTASQPETADEYLDAFRALNGSPSLANYSEFEVIRSQAIVETQVGSLRDDKRRRVRLVLRVLRSFDAAFRAARNGSTAESLRHTNATERYVDRLREVGGGSYAVLSELALDRFLENQGERLSDLARTDDSMPTPERIRLLEHAAAAYRRAGAVNRYSDMTIRIDNLRAEFRRDRARLNRSIATAASFVSRCGEACGTSIDAVRAAGPGVFGLYSDAMRANAGARTASRLAEHHELQDRAERANTLRRRTESAMASLAIASAGLALGYLLAVGLIVIAVMSRVLAWQSDVEAARVDEIVLIGGAGDE